MERVEVEGLSIAFERSGAGPPVVLLHGGLSDSREWRRQIDGLCDDFMVVAWDALGSGRSSDPPESFRMADYADCLASFVERPLALADPMWSGSPSEERSPSSSTADSRAYPRRWCSLRPTPAGRGASR